MKSERIKTWAILGVAIIGIVYFGMKAVQDDARENQNKNNPFAYSLDAYEGNDPKLNHYQERNPIQVPLEDVYGLVIAPDNRILVSGDQAIVMFDSTGSLRTRIEIGHYVRCLAIDDGMNIYCGLLDRVLVLDQTGKQKSVWSNFNENTIITSIAVSESAVYVADAGTLVIWKLDKAGRGISTIGEKDESRDIPGFVIPSPYFDVAIDADGRLWAANTGRHSIENYTPEGNLRTFWGTASMDIEGFAGCCNPSHFCFLPDGNFVTSEKGIVRVKVTDQHGRLISVVAGPDQFKKGLVGLDLACDSKGRIYMLDRDKKGVRVFEKV